jgi:hypothetical protein
MNPINLIKQFLDIMSKSREDTLAEEDLFPCARLLAEKTFTPHHVLDRIFKSLSDLEFNPFFRDALAGEVATGGMVCLVGHSIACEIKWLSKDVPDTEDLFDGVIDIAQVDRVHMIRRLTFFTFGKAQRQRESRS